MNQPLLQPWQVSWTFTLQGGKDLTKLVFWEMF